MTISASVDWNPYFDCMRPNGAIVFVGAITDKPLPLKIFGPFIAKQVPNSIISLYYSITMLYPNFYIFQVQFTKNIKRRWVEDLGIWRKI